MLRVTYCTTLAIIDMLSVIMLNVTILYVVAPLEILKEEAKDQKMWFAHIYSFCDNYDKEEVELTLQTL